MIDLPNEFLDGLKGLEDGTSNQLDLITSSIPTSKVSNRADARSLKEVLELVALIEKKEQESGTSKWFEHPYSIDSLPKHKAFFDASKSYNEICFLAANRVGKSVAGCYALSCHLTG